MDMAIKTGSFIEMNQNEILLIDGGDFWGVVGGITLGVVGGLVVIGSAVGAVASAISIPANPIGGFIGVASGVGGVYGGIQMFNQGVSIASNAW